MNNSAHPWQHQVNQPHKPAIIMADTGESLTYDQLMRHAAQTSRLLAELGCTRGDSIALLSENNATFVEVCWAAKNSGLYYACVSSQLNVDDATYIVANSDAKILIASLALSDLALEISRRLKANLTLLIFGGHVPGAGSYESLRDRAAAEPIAGSMRGASVLYSSGTTGLPKGVRTPLVDVPPTTPPLRHEILLKYYGFGPDMIFIDPGPFYHAAPLRMMMSVHREGGTVIGFKKFDADTVLRSIERFRATHAFLVPTMFNRMLQLPAATRAAVDLSTMRCAIHGAAPCTIATKEAMMAWWGPVIYELYGGTEGCGQTFISPPEWLRKKGSVGKAVSGCRIRIVDEHNRPVGANQIGLIYMWERPALRILQGRAKNRRRA